MWTSLPTKVHFDNGRRVWIQQLPLQILDDELHLETKFFVTRGDDLDLVVEIKQRLLALLHLFFCSFLVLLHVNESKLLLDGQKEFLR